MKRLAKKIVHVLSDTLSTNTEQQHKDEILHRCLLPLHTHTLSLISHVVLNISATIRVSGNQMSVTALQAVLGLWRWAGPTHISDIQAVQILTDFQQWHSQIHSRGDTYNYCERCLDTDANKSPSQDSIIQTLVFHMSGSVWFRRKLVMSKQSRVSGGQTWQHPGRVSSKFHHLGDNVEF